MHLGLVILLFVGPAFVPSRPPPEPTSAIISILPDELVDGALSRPSGGPAPEPRKPDPSPPEPIPVPQPKARHNSPPPRPAPARKPSRPSPPRTPHRIKINLHPEKRQPDRTTQRAAQRQVAARRARFNSAIQGLQAKLSSSTKISWAGPQGRSYADYATYVKSLYDRAWIAPEEINDTSATVKARVVIARDGPIITAEIVSSSGIIALDRSVRDALDRVKTIGKPFPQDVKETQRTYTLKFNLQARRSLP